MSEEEIQGEGFTVKDRRAFDSKGDIKEEFKRAQEEKAGEKEKEPKETRDTAPLPEINFSSFLLSLSSSTLLHLGEIADPQTGGKKKDLALAKQTIDIIALLKEKTKGNLSEEEGKLLEHLLYDLRMRFVKTSE
jgi:hypothetical protein